MKFCLITTFYPPFSFGGDAGFVRSLALELTRRSHKVEVIHCRDAYRALGGTMPAEEEIPPDPFGITTHGIESGWGALSPLATQQTGWPLFKTQTIKRILDKGFDVIHYHNISLVGGPEILQYGQGVKLYTWHEYWLVCPTSLLMRDGREPCSERHCFSCTVRQGRPPQLWRSTSHLARSLDCVDTFLAPSRFSISQHRELNLRAPVVHMPNFVAPAETLPRMEQADPYFLYAGRLEFAKGVHTLLPLFQRWNKARLVIAGVGAEGQRLRAAAASARIQFTGQLPIEKLRELYRNAVAVIVPSIWYELFPLVILEAFREGTPVIVRNIGSLPETVLDSGGGLLYSNDEELLAQAELLLSDGDLRDELGSRGRRAVETRWSAESHMQRYLGIVEALRQQRGSMRETCEPESQ